MRQNANHGLLSHKLTSQFRSSAVLSTCPESYDFIPLSLASLDAVVVVVVVPVPCESSRG